MTSHKVDVEYAISDQSKVPLIVVDGVKATIVDCEYHYHTSTPNDIGSCIMMADVFLDGDLKTRRLTVNLTTGISRIYF